MDVSVTGIPTKAVDSEPAELKTDVIVRLTSEHQAMLEAGGTEEEIMAARHMNKSMSMQLDDNAKSDKVSASVTNRDERLAQYSASNSGINLPQQIRDTVYKDSILKDEHSNETFLLNDIKTYSTRNDSAEGGGAQYQLPPFSSHPHMMQQMMSTLSVKDIADILKAVIKEGNSLNAKGELEQFKAMLKEYYLKEKERILIGREFYQYDIFINSEGRICRTITAPNIDKFKGDKISNCYFPKFEIIKPVGKGASGLIYKFSTSVNGKAGCCYFDDETLAVETFSRQLTKLGVKFFVAHASRKVVINDLLITLLDNAEVIELPVNSGWIKINGCWTWVPFGSKTFKEVRYEYLGK